MIEKTDKEEERHRQFVQNAEERVLFIWAASLNASSAEVCKNCETSPLLVLSV